MAAAEGWTPRRDNPYAGPGDEGLDDAAGAAAVPDPDATRLVSGADPDATVLSAAQATAGPYQLSAGTSGKDVPDTAGEPDIR